MDYYHLGHCYLAAVLQALQALIEGRLPGVLLYQESKLKNFVKISHEIIEINICFLIISSK